MTLVAYSATIEPRRIATRYSGYEIRPVQSGPPRRLSQRHCSSKNPAS
jgi:hypothetical protein